MAFEFTDANFQAEALENEGLTLIDFWAEWCGPCRAVAPIVEELSTEYEGRVKVGKMDVDSNQDVPFKYKVRSIPTLLLLKNGEVVDKMVGFTNKAGLVEKIEKQLVPA